MTAPTKAPAKKRAPRKRVTTPTPDGRTRLIRRGRGHSYELDGAWCPGVTTIIKGAVPMPALIGWAGRTVAEWTMDRLMVNGEHVLADELINDLRAFNEREKKPEKLGSGFSRVGLSKVLSKVMYAERDEAADRGTEVHSIAARIAAGEEVEVPEPLERHVDSYLRFLEEWEPTDAILEGVVINRRWRYMGRFDLIADLPRYTLRDGTTWGGRTLLDLKTGHSGPFGEDALQLAGYRYGETMLDGDGNEVPMPEVESTGILHVRADGYDLYPFVADEAVHRVFLYCAQVYKALDWKGDGLVAHARGDALRPPKEFA
ncbi:MAG: hypothetical protein WEA75_04735 [Acidimicrobiia bacterium]